MNECVQNETFYETSNYIVFSGCATSLFLNSLNVTRCMTGSQCSCCSAGLMCARRSKFSTSRAAAFCTRCSATSLHAGRPARIELQSSKVINLRYFVHFNESLIWTYGSEMRNGGFSADKTLATYMCTKHIIEQLIITDCLLKF